MTTSDPSDLPGGPPDGIAAAMEAEIARIANQLFASPDLGGGFALPGDPLAQPALGAGVASPQAVAPQALPGAGAVPLSATPDAAIGAADAPAFTPGVTVLSPALAAAPLVPSAGGPEDAVHASSSPFDGFTTNLFGAPSATAAPSATSAPNLAGAGFSIPFADAAGAPPAANDAPYFLEHARGPGDAAPVARPESLTIGAPFEIHPELVPGLATAPSLIDPYAVKRDFPILEERVHGKRLVWLDNAATTQKPRAVIDRISSFYEHENSNIHRAAHTLAARATDAYEGAREKVRRFLNAPSAQDIVFVRGATEGINLVAQSWGRRNVAAGDEIVITHLEHHANIVPWQMLCAEKGAKLRVAPVDSTGQIILDEYEKLLGPKTRIVAFTQVSNALGTILPAREMIEMAHRHGARVLLDGAQSASHMPVDVQLLDCDFFVFSGHKVFSPTGIGVVFGKGDVLAAMPPWQGGGNMISDVTFERTTYQPPPARFEAGTGNIADAVGLGVALDYVEALGRPNIDRYEHDLRVYAEGCLTTIPGLHIIGTAREKAGVISFVLDGVPTQEIGGMLDRDGIAVRSGHHCAQPILRRFGLEATVRASLAPYNTREDVEALVAAVRRIQLGARA